MSGVDFCVLPYKIWHPFIDKEDARIQKIRNPIIHYFLNYNKM